MVTFLISNVTCFNKTSRQLFGIEIFTLKKEVIFNFHEFPAKSCTHFFNNFNFSSENYTELNLSINSDN